MTLSRTPVDELRRKFLQRGWLKFGRDAALLRWIQRVAPVAEQAVKTSGNPDWLRCGDTWFVGVNALPNDEQGEVGDSGPLRCRAMDFVSHGLGLAGIALDRAQVSVIYPGYPRPMASESEAAYRYRRDRDAAHVDGLLKRGADNRRYLGEHHAFILGIPLTPQSPSRSPLVVWEASHERVRRAFRERFAGIPAAQWEKEDVTSTYHAVRQAIFSACRRIELAAQPGECLLVHRLALHGMAPWREDSPESGPGRITCYFRPPHGNPQDWLERP